MDKLRNDIIEAYSLIQSSLDFRWLEENVWWERIDLVLEDYFDNPLEPTETELMIFKLKFNKLCLSTLKEYGDGWQIQLYINKE